MPPLANDDKLKKLHKANLDLDYVINKYKSLNKRLEGLVKRRDILVSSKVLPSGDDREIRILELMKKREYDEAEKELLEFEGFIKKHEQKKDTLKDFKTRFIPIKEKWERLMEKDLIDEDNDILERVTSAVNTGKLSKAGKLLDEMEMQMESIMTEDSRMEELRISFEKLMEMGQELMDEGIIENRTALERKRLQGMLVDRKRDEMEKLLVKKFKMLEKIKADHKKASLVYNKIDAMIKDFTKKGKLTIPQEFEDGLKDYEHCDYANAYVKFKKARTILKKNIAMAEADVSIKVTTRGSMLKMNRWEELEVVLKNDGDLHLNEVSLAPASDNFKLDMDDEKISVKAGKVKKVPVRINFSEEGTVPIKLDISFPDPVTGKRVSRPNKYRFEVASSMVPEESIETAEEGPEPQRRHDSIRKKVKKVYQLKEDEQLDFKEGDFYSFKIIDKLGSGGFSTVYRVEREGEFFAMKTPKDMSLEREETIEINKKEMAKFTKEANIWATLTDTLPGDVIRLIDVGLQPFPWFVMELAECSLKEYVRDLSVNDRIDVTFEILTKFDRIHHQGIVHRDIKPENILFVNDEVKVTDFGISKLVSSSSRSTIGVSGTYFYMSPEQISKRKFGKVDWRTDIWQLGVLIYEILTESLPFDASDPVELTSNILHDEPLAISEISQKFEPLDGVLLKCLSKDKNKRPQSSIELKFAMEKALGV